MSSSSNIFVAPSLFKASIYAFHLGLLKSFAYVGSTIAAHKTKFLPTITKRLHPSLAEARIFFPPNTGKSSDPLPTLFSIHGGCFCMGQPANDNHINTRMAANGILVIALPYPLAPANSYPAPLIKATIVFCPPVSFTLTVPEILKDVPLPLDLRMTSSPHGYRGWNGDIFQQAPHLNTRSSALNLLV
jgi:hypothetical protein